MTTSSVNEPDSPPESDSSPESARVSEAASVSAQGIVFHISVSPQEPLRRRSGTSPRGMSRALQAQVQALLSDEWSIHPVVGLADWYTAKPEYVVPVHECWAKIQTLRQLPRLDAAEPLLSYEPAQYSSQALNPFATAYDADALGLWGTWQGEVGSSKVNELAAVPRWHLDQLRIPKPWATWTDKHGAKPPGDGVLVAHPDTGYTKHGDIESRLQLPGVTLVEGENPELAGLDDLTSGILKFPGHGTSTASVIVSPHDDDAAKADQVFGVAPGARVLPLRVSRSVIHTNLETVSKAILTAVERKAHVISMSLGAPTYSEFARACVRKAHDAGIIVVAAAGNNAPTTVFPAAFPEVIAVAATHAGEAPWRFSGLGRLVDIAAPGQNVWRAQTLLNAQGALEYKSSQGTGTSYGTACVAGLAAVWLSYHDGPQAVADKLGDPGLVHFAFQLLLTQTAQKKYSWVEKKLWGAGIPDADALLKAEIPEAAAVRRFRDVLRNQKVNQISLVGGVFRGIFAVTEEPAVELARSATITDTGEVSQEPIEQTAAFREAERLKQAEDDLIELLLGPSATVPATAARQAQGDELRMWISTQPEAQIWLRQWYKGMSLLPLYQLLLGPAARETPSPTETRQPSPLRRRMAGLVRAVDMPEPVEPTST